jgi:hypothetical protein
VAEALALVDDEEADDSDDGGVLDAALSFVSLVELFESSEGGLLEPFLA